VSGTAAMLCACPGAATGGGARGDAGLAAHVNAARGAAGPAPIAANGGRTAVEPALPRAAVGWSGGKDSALALDAVLREGRLAVHALVTTVTDAYDRISMHGVRRALLREQCAALGLPLVEVEIPSGCTNEVYEARTAEAFEALKRQGVERLVFGDLFLEDVRQYRENLAARLDLACEFPLWGRDTAELARAFIEAGFRAIVVCVDPGQLDPSFCGRAYDASFLADLPATCDPCGERGEFHTFVYDGPIFGRPVAVERGQVVEREGFWFADLLPANGSAGATG